ncbi:SWEET sugar transporter [Phytophthora cactorum]|nr:SWEET sugar transporter [Phytophthora cactorum]
MHKNHSTGETPCLLLFTNCYAIMFYALAIDNIFPLFADIAPLFVTSVLGVVVGGVLTCLFYCWASNKTESVQVIIVAVFVCVVVTIYGALAVTGVTGQSHSSVSTTLGFITIAATIVLYASPMATIIRVLQTKTASSMPYTMGVVNVLNSLGWILNSSLVDNMFIACPGGIILGTSLHTSIRTRHELTRRVRRCRLKMSTALQNSLLLPSRTKKTAKNGASRLITPAVLPFITPLKPTNHAFQDQDSNIYGCLRHCRHRVQGRDDHYDAHDASLAAPGLESMAEEPKYCGHVRVAVRHDIWQFVLRAVLRLRHRQLPAAIRDVNARCYRWNFHGLLVLSLGYRPTRGSEDLHRLLIRVPGAHSLRVSRSLRSYRTVTSLDRDGFGFIMVAFTTLMYASPMATIIRVVRAKTATSMPFTMGAVNVLNSFCWGVYGGLIHNNFLLIPNIIGVTLSLTQMLVTFVYRSKGANDALLSEDLVDVVVCSGEQNQSDDTDCKKKTDFVALRSPGRENAQTATTMGDNDTAILCSEIITIVTTVMMRVSLLPDFQRMRKMKSTGDMSVLPCVLLYANCYLLCWYSYAVDNIIPLFLTAALGVISGAILAVFFYKWTAHKRDVMKVFIISAIVMLLETIYGLIALLGWTGQSRSSTGTALGVLVIISSVGLYASPMATIRHVIRTKTSSSMPFTMGVVNVINSFCWVVYAILVDDVFILVPNASGALLGSIQLILTLIYPRKAPSEGQILSVTINDPRAGSPACGEPASLSVVAHFPAQDNRENRKSSAVEGSNFVLLRSPE